MKDRSTLWRIGLPLVITWSLAWIAGLGLLTAQSIQMRDALATQALDAELAFLAAAMYGLAWFEEDGSLNVEDVLGEPELISGGRDIWVTDAAGQVLFEPPDPRLARPDFAGLLDPVLNSAEEEAFREGVTDGGVPYRLYAMAHYSDFEPAPAGMIVVMASAAEALTEARVFARQLLTFTAALGVAGLVVGIVLTYWSLRPLQASLRQRQRFVAATAHELRTPIAGLQAICESARAGDEPPLDALERISSVLRRTSATVDDLLTFARLEGGVKASKEPVRLDLLIETLVDEAESVHLDSEPSIVELDPALAEVALRNLIDNARRHGGAEVRITVRGANVDIADDGPGFAPEMLALPLGRYTIAPSRTGNGLGLAIAHLVARLHGGAVSIANRQHGGARVSMTFG